jgi:uncharacterized DUF497 family protein
LDLVDTARVFEGRTATRADERFDYGEDRYITAGYLDDRFVVIVWTPRGKGRHIISFRYGHGTEQRRWDASMGGPR